MKGLFKGFANLACVATLVGLAACSDFPRDTEGTLERVRGADLRIGWPDDTRADPDLKRLVSRLAASTGSTARVEGGAPEALLMRLEAGEIDLVVGQFDRKTPWLSRVTLSRPVATHGLGKERLDSLAAIRNGEHAFAMEVDRVVLALAENKP